MFQTDTVDAFEYDRLYGREKYSLQKMEMKSINFPAEVEPGFATAVWSDRINNEWWESTKLIESRYTADALFAGATDESFMTFAKAIAKAIGFNHEVTGARITRYTNASSGYPCLVLEVTSGGKAIRKPNSPEMYPGGYYYDDGTMIGYN
jgi:hypothetical protein